MFPLQQSQAVPQHRELCRGGREQLSAEQPHPEPSPLEFPVQHAVDAGSTGTQSALRPLHAVSLPGSSLTLLTYPEINLPCFILPSGHELIPSSGKDISQSCSHKRLMCSCHRESFTDILKSLQINMILHLIPPLK